ncbi:MAG: amidohydrolase [Bacilli bacterium]|nr:amidohydrolase [Bacilli bacterium]
MITKQTVSSYHDYIISKRRDFHMHPEPGFQEFRTSKIIKEELLSFGFELEEGIGVTGIVGTLKGDHPGKTIGFRADIDALMMQEENDVAYKSTYPGVMHSCGHDTHTAMLLGTAKFFSEHKDLLHGTLKVIFQSAEEGPMPGGGISVVEGGYIDSCDAVFGNHITARDMCGMIAIKKGPAMAAPDEFKIKIIGTGTHASAPHTGQDPLLTASQIIMAFQNIISRNINPNKPAVISVCTIHGGTAFNIIPSTVEMTGTVRTLEPAVRDLVFSRMEETIKQLTALNQSTYEFEIIKSYPPLFNNIEMSDFVIDVASEVIGKENVIILDEPSMGGEDFSYYLERKPGAYFWLGGRNKNEPNFYNNHNPKFDIDEESLLIGTTLQINIILSYLNR